MMGSPSLFSPCVPVILSVFSCLRVKCSKLDHEQPYKNSYFLPKTMNLFYNLEPACLSGYNFSVNKQNVRKMDILNIISYSSSLVPNGEFHIIHI